MMDKEWTCCVDEEQKNPISSCLQEERAKSQMMFERYGEKGAERNVTANIIEGGTRLK